MVRPEPVIRLWMGRSLSMVESVEQGTRFRQLTKLHNGMIRRIDGVYGDENDGEKPLYDEGPRGERKEPVSHKEAEINSGYEH